MISAALEPELSDKIQDAAKMIKGGGVCVIPTETAYGLAASIRFEKALQRIYEIKKRPLYKPLLLIVEGVEKAPVDLQDIPKYALRLMEKFWPGPLTLLLPASRDAGYLLTGGTGKVGLRISSHGVAMELVREVGTPLTATSANLSGRRPSKTIAEVKRQFSQMGPDYFLDAGEIPPGPPSTIVDCQPREPVVIRSGAIPLEDILALG